MSGIVTLGFLTLFMDSIARLASQKAVVIFSKSSYCMSYAIKRLFYEQRVSRTIHKLNQDTEENEMEWALMRLGCSPTKKDQSGKPFVANSAYLTKQASRCKLFAGYSNEL
ncbi:hypothetical protein RJ639_013189 [Escallonia herrerae]|uniref:Uncharacterized protein n=1 Tax=Escallonia herrerae TaxID=1293975 RepID=A0AA88VPV0_9ASTE|nr:hypothetical protein RJ639_013189 [Escallonia herrerae]